MPYRKPSDIVRSLAEHSAVTDYGSTATRSWVTSQLALNLGHQSLSTTVFRILEHCLLLQDPCLKQFTSTWCSQYTPVHQYLTRKLRSLCSPCCKQLRQDLVFDWGPAEIPAHELGLSGSHTTAVIPLTCPSLLRFTVKVFLVSGPKMV